MRRTRRTRQRWRRWRWRRICPKHEEDQEDKAEVVKMEVEDECSIRRGQACVCTTATAHLTGALSCLGRLQGLQHSLDLTLLNTGAAGFREPRSLRALTACSIKGAQGAVSFYKGLQQPQEPCTCRGVFYAQISVPAVVPGPPGLRG